MSDVSIKQLSLGFNDVYLTQHFEDSDLVKYMTE